MDGSDPSVPNKPQLSLREWTEEEKKQLDTALSEFDKDISCLFEYLATRVPRKTIEQIQDRFISLLDDMANEDDYIIMSMHEGLEAEENNDDSDSSSEFTGTRGRRRRGIPWTEEEHRLFLLGMIKFGKGRWTTIHRNLLKTKTSKQIASHAQKFFLRLNNSPGSTHRRNFSVLDIRTLDASIPMPPKEMHCKPIAPSPFPRSDAVFPPYEDNNMYFEGLSGMPNRWLNNNDNECMNSSMKRRSMGSSSNTMMTEPPLHPHLPNFKH